MEDSSPRDALARDARSPTTIYDVARAVGVSPSTVSRALNKPGRINPRTEERIRAAAADLGYRINPLARALHTGRTRTLALILSDITNPVYFDLVRGAERVTAAADYTLVLSESQESAGTELDNIERIMPSVDGMILVASRLDDDVIRSVAARKPLALVNRRIEGIASIVPDATPGIRAALEHLHALGHRFVAFLSGPTASRMSEVRWSIAFEHARSIGLHIVEIGPNAPTVEGGRGCLPRVLAAGVTAVLSYNDLMAIGLLGACRSDGIDVPGRLSIVGFDDIFGSSFTSPAITTIRSPLDEAGEQAAHMLVDDDLPTRPALATTFVPRDSTGAPEDTTDG